MSNVIAGPVWECDTAGVLTDKPVKVKNFHWLNPTNAGDDLRLVDKGGNVVLVTIAESSGLAQFFKMEKWFDGLEIDTIDSGILYVEYE